MFFQRRKRRAKEFAEIMKLGSCQIILKEGRIIDFKAKHIFNQEKKEDRKTVLE